MAYRISFFIFLGIFLSFSNCLETYNFNISKIDLYNPACNKKEGKYRFWIRGVFDSESVEHFIFYINLESPSDSVATCLLDFIQDSSFLCFINLVSDPLTEKKVVLPKKAPFSSHYEFSNWEEYMNKNGNIVSENIDCIPTIHNTFIYSYIIIENEKHFIINGEWSDKSKSLTPEYNINCYVILVNSTLKDDVSCIYNLEKKTEFNCTNYGRNSPVFEDQLISGSDNYVYKLEKKSESEDNGLSFISLNISIFLLLSLLIL